MPIDIEYPIPGDCVGNTFHCGGTYEATRLTIPPGGPAQLAAAANIVSGQIVCQVFDGSTLLDTQNINLAGHPDSDIWDVTFHTIGNHNDCTIKVELQIPGLPNSPDTCEDVDIDSNANSDIGVA